MRDTPKRITEAVAAVEAAQRTAFEALVAAFCKVPRPVQQVPGIPCEMAIPSIARQLLLMLHKEQRPLSPKRLDALDRKISQLLAQEDLPPRVRRPLNAALLETRIETSRASSTGGRPPKDRARKVAEFVGEQYRALTGESPTFGTDWDDGKAYGPFLELIKDVFCALGIKASEVHLARHVRGMHPEKQTKSKRSRSRNNKQKTPI